MKTIYFVTSNKGKFSEIKEKLTPFNINVIQKNIGYPEIQSETLEDVVRFGIKHIQKQVNHAFIIEDAGLFVDILDGFPGVYSKYVYYTIGCEGVLKLLKNVESDKRTALFRSVYGLSEPNKNPLFFTGECHGKISMVEKGKGGFGYDPIFIPNGEKKTFAEMSIQEKNSLSHRGNAIEKLIDYLNK